MIYEKNKTKAISFPLGGIGTGSIGLAGNGELIDWEIFNKPNKCTRNYYSHFAIKATRKGKSTAKVLQGDVQDNLMGIPCKSLAGDGYGYGPRANSLAGFPHFRNVCFDGSFPVARLTFTDEDFPAVVRLCAFNPMIPHDEYNSSLPAAFFEWEIENACDEEVSYALGATLANPAAHATKNTTVQTAVGTGLFLREAALKKDEVGYCDLCLFTDNTDTVVQEYWYRGKWQDGCTTYWRNFCDLDRMNQRSYPEAHKKDHGTVVSYVHLAPGEKAKLRFLLTWSAPIAKNTTNPREGEDATWRNYYATQFETSLQSAEYALSHFDTLRDKTLAFSDALQACPLPEAVKDAVSANLSVLKSPTSLRLEDGSFWGWEGCFERGGSCYGTCQHVWNYAYAMPYLFPRLERSIRENFLRYGLQEDGASLFRLILPLKKDPLLFRACVDGQMGEVIKCYREWKLSGKDDWLKEHAEGIFKMLEYAWSEKNPDAWDRDMDGVLEGRQHHTLDMELFGPSSWLQGFYLLALDCGAKMADFLGESERARLYSRLYQQGRAWMNEHLFNGRYFQQAVDLSDRSILERFDATERYWNEEAKEIKYQVAEGCIIDQMLADWHAVLIGSEGVFDKEKKKTALEHLYRYNYKDSMREVANMWRNFAINDERGTVICSYPEGSKLPAIPIPYCEETMTGFEYALAGLMISQGYLAEGERMVEAIRDRYDGEKRNPWNEIECGSNYARSMASFALLPIYSGFSFDMSKKHLGFAPIGGDGSYLFSVAESWGCFTIDASHACLRLLGNPLTLRSLSLPNAEQIQCVMADGKKIPFSAKEDTLFFDEICLEAELLLQ